MTHRPEGAFFHDIDLSVVIPVFNEAELIDTLYDRLKSSLELLAVRFEVILINDGSRDETPRLLAEIAQKDNRFRVIHLARNFGHQIAITCGIDHASGKAVMIMDADLQDPPEIIEKFYSKWKEGYEVIYAIRRNRKENALKRLAYSSFYQLLQKITSIEMPLDSGDFGLIDQKVVQVLRSLPERNRFVRGLRSWIGFKQVGLEYERDKRYAGEVKYTLSKLMKLALDGIFSFSFAPLRLATYFGLTVSSLSFILGIIYLIQKLTVGIQPEGWASTMVIILFLGGVQLLTIGIIGEYIGRIYDEVKSRPIYLISSQIGFPYKTIDRKESQNG
ncbi:MAG: glycosyltransferase family 2 protein [Chloroherpetonaceae bacterium]|nr:glycosyltransferase family 2 protein [Chloroherpetonaceae bacterium]